ncbi:MAG: acetolactate synthase [Butyrivibrio sp.]|nr:acetolactate synthase [Butyrivibrio sp.]
MSVMQISVFLENKPGTLKKMTSVLAAHKIDLRATSLAETKDFGIARLVVDDALSAVNTLKENNFVASLTPVLAMEISDETGGLDQLLTYFDEAKVNIEYMYAFSGGSNAKHAYMIFRVSDTNAAEAKLAGKGIKMLTQEDLAQI